MDHFAGSWSFPSDFGTPFLTGELTTAASPEPERKGRRAERVPIEIGAGLRQRGARGLAQRTGDRFVEPGRDHQEPVTGR